MAERKLRKVDEKSTVLVPKGSPLLRIECNDSYLEDVVNRGRLVAERKLRKYYQVKYQLCSVPQH